MLSMRGYWNRVLVKMADDSSVLPIWCDVGKNLNAAYMVVSLGDVTKGRPTYDGNSKQIVQIYSRYLTFDGHEFSTAVDANSEGDRNTVRYPGKYLLLLFKSSLKDNNEFARLYHVLNCREILHFSRNPL